MKGTYQPFIRPYAASESIVNKLSDTMRVDFVAFDFKVSFSRLGLLTKLAGGIKNGY